MCLSVQSDNKLFLYFALVKKRSEENNIRVVAWKLLILIYTLWKNNETYDPEYEIKKVDKCEPAYAGWIETISFTKNKIIECNLENNTVLFWPVQKK